MNKDNIYWDFKGKIWNFLNKLLHETLFPQSSIILITFFCNLKIMECDPTYPLLSFLSDARIKDSIYFYKSNMA